MILQTHMPAMAKFTDLAELVSQIEKPKHGKKPTFYSENDDIFEEDSDGEGIFVYNWYYGFKKHQNMSLLMFRNWKLVLQIWWALNKCK